jgi:hypothetical protein
MSQSLSITEEKLRARRSLEERLSAHPHLLERIEALLNVVENSASDVEEADVAEQPMMEQVRQIGQQALTSWAEVQHQKQSELLRSYQPQVRQHLKKNSTGTPALESSSFKSSSLPKGKENRECALFANQPEYLVAVTLLPYKQSSPILELMSLLVGFPKSSKNIMASLFQSVQLRRLPKGMRSRC